jgi:hypothetical protein
MTQYLFIWVLFVLTLLSTITLGYFAIVINTKNKALFVIVLIGFIGTLVQAVMLLDYFNNIVVAPKFKSEQTSIAPIVSEKPIEVMPNASSFTKEVVEEHGKQLKEFEKR